MAVASQQSLARVNTERLRGAAVVEAFPDRCNDVAGRTRLLENIIGVLEE